MGDSWGYTNANPLLYSRPSAVPIQPQQWSEKKTISKKKKSLDTHKRGPNDIKTSISIVGYIHMYPQLYIWSLLLLLLLRECVQLLFDWREVKCERFQSLKKKKEGEKKRKEGTNKVKSAFKRLITAVCYVIYK
jgi:hypothetical protein